MNDYLLGKFASTCLNGWTRLYHPLVSIAIIHLIMISMDILSMGYLLPIGNKDDLIILLVVENRAHSA